MKDDECDLITGKNPYIHPKRLKYIYRKWVKKGWWDDGLTLRGHHIAWAVRRVEEDYDIPDEFEGRVVNVYCRKWLGHAVGIFLYHGDNGWHFYTIPQVRRRSSYILEKSDIAYIELHPEPQKIWRKINYEYWKRSHEQEKYRREDFFHQKVGYFYKVEGLKEGDCLPNCECKFLW